MKLFVWHETPQKTPNTESWPCSFYSFGHLSHEVSPTGRYVNQAVSGRIVTTLSSLSCLPIWYHIYLRDNDTSCNANTNLSINSTRAASPGVEITCLCVRVLIGISLVLILFFYLVEFRICCGRVLRQGILFIDMHLLCTCMLVGGGVWGIFNECAFISMMMSKTDFFWATNHRPFFFRFCD